MTRNSPCPNQEAFRRLYVDLQWTVDELEREYGCSQRVVYRWLQEAGIPRRKRGALNIRHLDAENVRRLYYDENMSVEEVAVALKASERVVENCMNSHGMKRRKRGPRDAEHHGSWNGGWTTDKSGYILIFQPDHPDARSTGYVPEHRLVMEKKLGRRLTRQEVVHHKDRNKKNNDPENLELFAKNPDHLRHELTGKCPKWTEDGKRRIQEGVRRKRGPRQSKSTAPASQQPGEAKSS